MQFFFFLYVQISSSCPGEFHYKAELIPTYSNKRLIINKNSTRPILTLSSTDIQLNEVYKIVVRIDGVSGPLHSFNLSMYILYTDARVDERGKRPVGVYVFPKPLALDSRPAVVYLARLRLIGELDKPF